MSIQLKIKYPALKRSKKNSMIREGINQDIEYDDWHLPGQKEKKQDCGIWSYMGCTHTEKHANGKIFLKPFERSCFRADCEKCCYKWLGRSASKATERIKHYENQSKRPAKHIVISVPHWDYYKPKKELSKKVHEILRFVKCDSGLIIFHPFRYHKNIKQWYYSPHFHVLGFGWIENSVETYNENGYIVKNLGKRETVFGTIYYQLSHAGIKKHNHALTYFGNCSYCKLILPKNEEESNKCPFCKEYLVELDYNRDCSYPPDPNIVTVEGLIEIYDWFVKCPDQKI